MRRPLLRHLVWAGLAACVFAGAVAAQAPIIYAGSTPGERDNSDARRPASEERRPSAATQVSTPRAATQSRAREREQAGRRLDENRRRHAPAAGPAYEEVGLASWYGAAFHGRSTASGEPFDQRALTAAHPTLPIPSLVRVTNLANGREAIVRVNDRGPFAPSRLIDVSRAAAETLGFADRGYARVRVRYLGPAPGPAGADGAATPASGAQEAQTTALASDQELAGGPDDGGDRGGGYRGRHRGGGGYVVQIGDYADLDDARRARVSAAAAGPVTVEVWTARHGQLFRVSVGPWARRAEADAARRTLAELGYIEAVVTMR